MSWKDQLIPASFRGVTFGVFDTDVLFGRRNQLHEYPLRDEPYGEDLGKKAREYTINAFVIGDDYISSRDALIAAIENNSKPGTLVHPTLGTKTVIPKDCRVIFNNQEGGIERFQLTFVEAGTNQFPSSLVDTQGITDLLSTSGISSFVSSFSDSFNVNGLPDFVSSASQLISGNFSDSLLHALGLGIFDNDLYSSFKSLLNIFDNNSQSDMATPSTFGGNVTNLITTLSTVFPNPNDAFQAQKSLTTFGDILPNIIGNTPARIQQAKNQDAYVNLVRNTATVEMIRLTSQMDYSSRQDAISIRDNVNIFVDSRLITLGDGGFDDDFTALSKARAAMVKDINSRGAKLPELLSVKTYDAIPALVLAYEHYEDATRDQEIIDRNHIRNPVFIPGNSNIELLA